MCLDLLVVFATNRQYWSAVVVIILAVAIAGPTRVLYLPVLISADDTRPSDRINTGAILLQDFVKPVNRATLFTIGHMR